MAHAEQVIINPVTGERMTFLQTAADTGGAALRAQVMVTPQKAFLPLHIHGYSSERWEIVSGRLGIRLGRETFSLGSGEQAVAPAGVPHTWWNDGPEAVRFLVEVVPAGKMEIAFEGLYGLARDGKVVVAKRRMFPINILDLALLLRLARSYAAEPPVPVSLQRITYDVLSALALRLGYSPDFQRYRDVSVPAELL